ncbi:M23 family metallopeptidase [Nocardia higoensis]|uniref:M23 family metallopeptidase n=1 Tax=Nocardia higoensis TaxID=228599 RepID=A0ABS0D658_9NOCA|nr:M23 family metallopeptidase [Nocardia higoensis]MBF6353963.1 M23 family metallopeptidase [Nocardia higoensis]
MPVTDSLPTVRPSTAASRRRRAAGRSLALAAAVGISLTTVNAFGPEEAGAASAAEIVRTPRVLIDSTTDLTKFTAFSSREVTSPELPPLPGLPEITVEQTPWAEHLLAQLAPPPPPPPAPPRPTTVRPTAGVLTSGFGYRWGAMHAGLDFGDPLGAPIAAVTDGVVIEAGPAGGFGLWVRVQQDDGSIGVYGHMNDILVSVGQPVRAGDVIATVGSRGYSTGPHLHYEVHLPGVGPIDPAGWLSARGIDVHH